MVTMLLTMSGRMGASHMCLPSSVSYTPSTSLSGVLMSPFTPSSIFTLSGNAAMSGVKHYGDGMSGYMRGLHAWVYEGAACLGI